MLRCGPTAQKLPLKVFYSKSFSAVKLGGNFSVVQCVSRVFPGFYILGDFLTKIESLLLLFFNFELCVCEFLSMAMPITVV